MSETTRTFIAVAIPPPVSENLTRLQSLLSPQVPGIRWATTLPFHMTLAFLGDVPDPHLNKVCNAVSEAARPLPPFQLRVVGIGAFPSPDRPRVVWAGLTAPNATELRDLQKGIVLGVTRVGYRPEDQRFTPHTTLGRIRSDRRSPAHPNFPSIVEEYRSWSGGTFSVHEVVTFASSLSPDGPVYTPLARAQLSGKKNSSSA
jgi:2'-5' RNA ligase